MDLGAEVVVDLFRLSRSGSKPMVLSTPWSQLLSHSSVHNCQNVKIDTYILIMQWHTSLCGIEKTMSEVRLNLIGSGLALHIETLHIGTLLGP